MRRISRGRLGLIVGPARLEVIVPMVVNGSGARPPAGSGLPNAVGQARARGVFRSVVRSALVLLLALGAAGLSALPAHAAVLGAPWTWGGNGFGQLGDGSTASRLSPAAVAGLTDVIDLHGGREHVVALRADGTVWTWGSNVEGQLGLGTTSNSATPMQVPGLADVIAVETGHNHTVALTAAGTVWTWGLNSDGQLGDGGTTIRRSPVQVTGLTDATAIAAGRDMTYAVRTDGTAVAWGRNAEGQLGNGTTVASRSPVPVASLTGIRELAGGRDHALAVLADGSVWAWGHNAYGQVGDGTLLNRSLPVQVASGMVAVAAGAHHSYALRSDGQVAAWGRNYRANLGDGSTTQRTRPVLVRNVTNAVSIGSGRDHGVAVLADGTVRTWGHNASGQLGDGTLTNRTSAVVVAGVSGAVKAGGGGSAYSVILVATTQPNQPPTAHASVSCTLLDCTFSAATSSDPDGSIVGYAWDFGDTATGAGVGTTHTYAAPGSYAVTLTVTDDDGAIGTEAVSVTVSIPPTGAVEFRAAAGSDANTSRPAVVVPASVVAGDQLVLFVTTNRAATLTAPLGWSVRGVVSDGLEMRSWLLERVADGATAGSTVRVTLDATSKTSMVLLAYAASSGITASDAAAELGSSASHAAPASSVAVAGSTAVRFWADKTSTVHDWTVPATVTARVSTTGAPSGMITAVAADQAGLPIGTLDASIATAGVSSSKALAWTVVLAPAG